jgi:GrpB-like predicted nucleotidyltransferase (UPF0157 family)
MNVIGNLRKTNYSSEGVMSDPIIVVPFDPSWKDEFIRIGKTIRTALGDIARSIISVQQQ